MNILCGRITPAYTGKRDGSSSASMSSTDHPRIHGEKLDILATYKDNIGSPPHTRGKALWRLCGGWDSRITPAYTGKSIMLSVIPVAISDHPRIHGEKYNLQRIKIWSKGSPPHTRGKGKSPGHCNTRNRITPAYTGKSLT